MRIWLLRLHGEDPIPHTYRLKALLARTVCDSNGFPEGEATGPRALICAPAVAAGLFEGGARKEQVRLLGDGASDGISASRLALKVEASRPFGAAIPDPGPGPHQHRSVAGYLPINCLRVAGDPPAGLQQILPLRTITALPGTNSVRLARRAVLMTRFAIQRRVRAAGHAGKLIANSRAGQATLRRRW